MENNPDKSSVDSYEKVIEENGLSPLAAELIEKYGNDAHLIINEFIHYIEEDCSDNLRICKVGNKEEEKQYKKQLGSGCCGFYDRYIHGKDGTYRFGFNYGH